MKKKFDGFHKLKKQVSLSYSPIPAKTVILPELKRLEAKKDLLCSKKQLHSRKHSLLHRLKKDIPEDYFAATAMCHFENGGGGVHIPALDKPIHRDFAQKDFDNSLPVLASVRKKAASLEDSGMRGPQEAKF